MFCSGEVETICESAGFDTSGRLWEACALNSVVSIELKLGPFAKVAFSPFSQIPFSLSNQDQATRVTCLHVAIDQASNGARSWALYHSSGSGSGSRAHLDVGSPSTVVLIERSLKVHLFHA